MGVANQNLNKRTRSITIGSIITALSVVILWLTSVFVFNKLSILVICTVLIAVVLIETERKVALLTYIASGILGMMLVPNKLIMIYYIVLFGNYAIVKQIIESLKTKRWIQLLLKGIYFNGILVLVAELVRLMTGISVVESINMTTMIDKVGDIQLSTIVILGIVVYQAAWLFADYILSKVFILYYQRVYKRFS